MLICWEEMKVSIPDKDFDRLRSFEELMACIDMGLDIEFILYGTRYDISWRDQKPFICTCPDGDAVFFTDAQDMMNHYFVEGKPIKDIWQDFQILSM